MTTNFSHPDIHNYKFLSSQYTYNYEFLSSKLYKTIFWIHRTDGSKTKRLLIDHLNYLAEQWLILWLKQRFKESKLCNEIKEINGRRVLLDWSPEPTWPNVKRTWQLTFKFQHWPIKPNIASYWTNARKSGASLPRKGICTPSIQVYQLGNPWPTQKHKHFQLLVFCAEQKVATHTTNDSPSSTWIYTWLSISSHFHPQDI